MTGVNEKVEIGNAVLYCGKCEEVLPDLDIQVSSVVTDPPYGLKFMGKKWDYDVPTTEQWLEVLRVLLPGGHLLSFAGTRTQHRMAVRIEDAGFEIRDMIGWLYASGFPKSLDISKAIDKAAGAEREVVGTAAPVKRMIPGADQNSSGSWIKDGERLFTKTFDIPATQSAREWMGWGTGLKPAFEPLTLARKPIIGTMVKNILGHGCGGLNIDACRVLSLPRRMRARARARISMEISGMDPRRILCLVNTAKTVKTMTRQAVGPQISSTTAARMCCRYFLIRKHPDVKNRVTAASKALRRLRICGV